MFLEYINVYIIEVSIHFNLSENDYIFYSWAIGFSEGHVSLVDSQPPENVAGSLPDGSFVDHMTLTFCCRSDGFTRNPIQLPNKESFIMFKESSSCQNVEGKYI